MTTAISACPRCGNRLFSGGDYPYCVRCGHEDYGPLTEASVFSQQLRTPDTWRRPRNDAVLTWVYREALSHPSEDATVTVKYVVDQNPKRRVAVCQEVVGWPSRWTSRNHVGQKKVRDQFFAAVGLPLTKISECLESSATAGWADRGQV